MFKISQAVAGAAALALLATAAQAAPITVKASDLDLSTPAGQKELDKRAEQAATALCKGVYNARDNCVPGAKAKIVAKATADGSATVDKNGKAMVFVGPSMAQN